MGKLQMVKVQCSNQSATVTRARVLLNMLTRIFRNSSISDTSGPSRRALIHTPGFSFSDDQSPRSKLRSVPQLNFSQFEL